MAKVLRPLVERIERFNRIDPAARIDPQAWISGCRISGPVTIREGAIVYRTELSGKVAIGRYSSLWGPGVNLSGPRNGIRIGAFCSIARGALMYELLHNAQRTTTYYLEKNVLQALPRDTAEVSKGEIVIGNDVWIGANAQVASGVRVGDGAIIGAGAIVTRNVPDFAVVGGNPARILRYRFDEVTMEKVRGLRWWDWPIEQIRSEQEMLLAVHPRPTDS